MTGIEFLKTEGYTIRCRIPLPEEYGGYIYGYARRHSDDLNRLSVMAFRTEMPPRWVEKADKSSDDGFFRTMKFEVFAKDVELLDSNDNPLTGNEDDEDMTW